MSDKIYSAYNTIGDPLSDEEKDKLDQSIQQNEAIQRDLEIRAQEELERQEMEEAQLRAEETQRLQASEGGAAIPGAENYQENAPAPQQPEAPAPAVQQEGPKQPGDEGTNPNRPTEGEEDQYQWNAETGEYEMKSGAAVGLVAETVVAPMAGTLDGFTDIYNYFMPGPDIPKLPKFQNENIEVIRNVSSFIGPQLTGMGVIGKGARALHSAGKAPQAVQALGNNPLFQWFATLGLDGAVGAVIDQSNADSTGDNMQRQLRDALRTPEGERLFGIFPADWATSDRDSPDEKRAKNRNEGFGLGMFSGVAEGLVRVFAAAKSTQRITTKIRTKDTSGAYVTRTLGDEFTDIKYSDDPIEDSILRSEARTQRNLDELGEFYVAKQNEANLAAGQPYQQVTEMEFPDGPVKGIHDQFDIGENGVRTADPDGAIGAAIDAARVKYNIGTRYGRLGSIVTEAALKWGLEVENLSQAQLVNAVLEHIESSGKFDALIGDTIISAKQIDEAGTELAEIMEDMRPGEMRLLLDNYKKLNDDLNLSVVNKVGYDAVFKSIKRYQEVFLNLDEKKARALLTTSLAGQASDMAGEIRNLEGSAAIEAAREQIFNRMEYLMVEKALASYDAGSTLRSLNVWERIKQLADGTAAKDYVLRETEARERFLGQLIPDAKGFTQTLMELSDSNPEFLKPLFDAYHMTDGHVSSMYLLNKYVMENLGQIKQFVARGKGSMPNLIVQGFWSNYYNSILSSTVTPVRAVVGNTTGLIARPINTMVGSLMSGDLRGLHRASVQYTGVIEGFQRAWQQASLYMRKATENPMSVRDIDRADLRIKQNEEQFEILKGYADASSQNGEYGPQFLLQLAEDMHSVASSPWMRYSANLMGAADAMTRAFIATAETRGRVYDQLFKPGQKVSRRQFRDAQQQIYDQMVNKDGFVSEKYVNYYNGEIALNLESDMAKGVSSLIANQPWMKPFILFPTTSVNMLTMFTKYSPLAYLTKDFHDLTKYGRIDNVPLDHIRSFMERKGLPFNENSIQAFDQMRREAKGRMAVGSLSVLAVTTMMTQDRLRGTGHWDKERQRVRTDLGWKKKTYLGTDGKWHSYDWLGPIGDWIAAVADLRDNFNLISTPAQEKTAEKLMYVLASAITDRSVMAMVEPMNDVLAGNSSAATRWGANFLNSTIPLAGARNQFGRLLSEGLKEVDDDLVQLWRNRNNYLDVLDGEKSGALDKYDWVDGERVGYEENFWQRVYNNFTGFSTSSRMTEAKQFLIDIEYDRRPTFKKSKDGIEFTAEQRAQLFSLIGQDQAWRRDLRQIMKDAESGGFLRRLRAYRRKGIGSDPTTGVNAEDYLNIYARVNEALERAKWRAEANMDAETKAEITRARSQKSTNETRSRRGLTPLNYY